MKKGPTRQKKSKGIFKWVYSNVPDDYEVDAAEQIFANFISDLRKYYFERPDVIESSSN